MRRWAAILLCTGLVHAQEEPLDLPGELARIVDLPTPQERARAAEALSKKEGVSLEQLQEAARAFGAFPPPTPGIHVKAVSLHVEGKVERTEIHVQIPAGYDPDTPAPLMLALHGSGGQGAHQLGMWHPVAQRLGMIVIAPTEAGKNEGYAFKERERRAALAALRWARRNFNVDENRVFVGGVSRGGHMTWDIALRHPDLFAALAPIIGGPRLVPGRGQNNLRYLDNIVHLPIRDLQGSRDDPLMLFNLRWTFKELEKLGAKDARLVEFPDLGHAFHFQKVPWAEWLPGKKRNPRPDTVRRATAKRDETRSFWIEILRTSSDVKETFRPTVQAKTWNRMNDNEKRLFLHGLALKKTATLTVTMKEPGRFVAKSRGVKKFRLLLTPEMFKEGEPVVVRFGGREVKRKARPQAKVLLQEFAERFDRTFLPVASITVP
jgi:dienelactone hydrolase